MLTHPPTIPFHKNPDTIHFSTSLSAISYIWLILYMGKIEQPVPDTPDDPIMAIEHQCQLYGLTDLERLKLADLIASHLYDPDPPPLNINQAIQTILDQREETSEED